MFPCHRALLLLFLIPASALLAGDAPKLTRALEPAVPPDIPDFGAGEPQLMQPLAFEEASLQQAATTTSLPAVAPFELRVHEYPVTSFSTWVVEVLREGQRHALFTHVDAWVGPHSLSSDGRHLYLSNHLLQADSSWRQLRRIVRLEDKRRVALPRLDCTERGGFWDGERLITYGLNSEECCPAPGLSTPVCVWNTAGELQGLAEVHACWHAYAAEALSSQIGLLSADPVVLWLYNGDCPSMADPDAACMVHMQELGGERRARSLELPGARGEEGCAAAEAITIEPGASSFEQDSWSAVPSAATD